MTYKIIGDICQLKIYNLLLFITNKYWFITKCAVIILY